MMNSATSQENAGKILDVLTGKSSPQVDFNVAFENDTILKIIGGAMLAGLVIILMSKVIDRLI